MTGRIFISYRRADSQYATDRIYDRLSAHFGSENVFMDIDDIPLGVNFRTYIDQQVSTSEIVLAVIGDHWLSAVDSEGNLRLDHPSDFVRLELEAALNKGIKLIPLFIGNVQSLPGHRLPDSLKELPMLNATRIRRGTDFEGDISKLVRGIERIFAQQEELRQRNTSVLLGLKDSTASIVGQLSGFEVLLIQEMRKRTQLENLALEIEQKIKEILREPGKQLRADVASLERQVEALRDEITELSFQIEERKQANQLKQAHLQANEDRILREQAEAERVSREKAEADRVVREQAEAERIAREQAEAERIAEQGAQARRIAKEKADAERIAKQKAKAERAEKQRASKLKRKAAITEFRTQLGKVPLWVWGIGLAVIVLVAAGLIFGPSLVESFAASDPSSTVAPTEITQIDGEPQTPTSFLEWSEAISYSTPDYIEDFSVYSYTWSNEVFPGHNIADFVNDAGELVIVDDPAESQDYVIQIAHGADFQLQFEFSPRLFTTGIPLIIDFMVDNEERGGFFRLNRDGTWEIRVNLGGKEEKLDAGEIAPLSEGEIYTFRLINKEGRIAMMVNGELLSFVENPIHGEGNIQIFFQAYKAFEVVYDNILFWDLSDDEYLVDPPEDQAYAFFEPVRQYLANTNPSFEEDFQEYQPYWDEMYVPLSDTINAELAQLISEGELVISTSEDLELLARTLYFPQITGQSYALQYDFRVIPGNENSQRFTTVIDTPWELTGELHNSPYCGFDQTNQEAGCGMVQSDDTGRYDEIFASSRQFQREFSDPSTLLVIFFHDKMAIFLNNFFMGYTNDLELSYQQIGMYFEPDESEKAFQARIDNIRFWNLDGVVYQPAGENGETQLAQNPVLEYLVSTDPSFREDFETPQAYWNSVSVYQDDQQGTSLGERVSDGLVRLDSREEEMNNHYWDLTFPQFQESANFALEFDVDFVDADSIGAFIESSSGSFLFNLQVVNGRLATDLSKETNDGENQEEPDTIISNRIAFEGQTSTILLVSYQSQFAIFINDMFLGFAEGLDIAHNPEIVIFVPAGDEVTVVEFDNIQYWNLDGVEINMRGEGSFPDNDFDIERTLAYTKNELAPTFEDDFSQDDMVWGGTSEGLAIWSLVENGELVITDHAEEVDMGTDHGVSGLTFPTNGLFDAANFLLEFDINQNKSSVNEVGLFFRQSGNQDGGYQFVVVPGGGWILNIDGEERYGTFSSSGDDHVAVLVKDNYFIVWLNDMPVVYEDQSLMYSGNLNQVWVSGDHGSEAVFDNFRFWNLDGVEIE